MAKLFPLAATFLRLDLVAVVTNLIKSVASVDDVGSVDRPIPDVQAVDLL